MCGGFIVCAFDQMGQGRHRALDRAPGWVTRGTTDTLALFAGIMLLLSNSACQNGPGATGGERLVPELRERICRGQQRSAHYHNEPHVDHLGVALLFLPS